MVENYFMCCYAELAEPEEQNKGYHSQLQSTMLELDLVHRKKDSLTKQLIILEIVKVKKK